MFVTRSTCTGCYFAGTVSNTPSQEVPIHLFSHSPIAPPTHIREEVTMMNALAI